MPCRLAHSAGGIYSVWERNRMEKEFVDRAKAIRQGILQLRDSL
jgi:hypothetical protein